MLTFLSNGPFFLRYGQFHLKYPLFRQKMMSLLLRNFVGADKELQAMFRGAFTFYKDAASLLAQDNVDWVYIPPYAPHFGGLWESGVKSVKNHIKGVIGDQSLTSEELSTFLCQIEAYLNSRRYSTIQ